LLDIEGLSSPIHPQVSPHNLHPKALKYSLGKARQARGKEEFDVLSLRVIIYN
jgi:hypothetical protein